jgi:cytoskeletal protein RodZ
MPLPRAVESSLAHEIAQEVEWRGPFLRKVREARRISIEEMSNITKVTKSYLLAIEEENFPRLPAPVFMRGFVTQMAKVLKLPHDQVAAAYMARYYQSRPDKTAK